MKKIWKFLRSMAFGMILLGLILICSLCGSLIAQGNAPAWYVETYPKAHAAILALGLNDVFGSWYFILLCTLLCLNLVFCSLIRLPQARKAARNAVVAMAERPGKPLTAAGEEKLRAWLALRRCRVARIGERDIHYKNTAGWYGSFVTHLAILLTVLFGAAAIYLPQVTDQTCMPGASLTMEDGTVISVDSFHIENELGELDYSSVIRMRTPDGATGGPAEISVNHPFSFGSYKIYQQTYGTAGSVTVRNTATGGEDVFTLDEMCFLSMDGKNGVWFEALYPGYLRDADGNFTLITQTSGHYEDPVYQILLSSDGVNTPVLAFPGETVTVGGVEYTFNDPVEYPGLRIKKTPVLVNGLLVAAFVLMIAGLWLCFFGQPLVVAVWHGGYAVGGPKPQGTELELAAQLEEEKKEGDPC